MKYDNDAHQDHNKKMVTKYRWIGAPYLSNMYYKYLAKSAVYERLEATFTLTKTMQWMRQGPKFETWDQSPEIVTKSSQISDFTHRF